MGKKYTKFNLTLTGQLQYANSPGRKVPSTYWVENNTVRDTAKGNNKIGTLSYSRSAKARAAAEKKAEAKASSKKKATPQTNKPAIKTAAKKATKKTAKKATKKTAKKATKKTAKKTISKKNIPQKKTTATQKAGKAAVLPQAQDQTIDFSDLENAEFTDEEYQEPDEIIQMFAAAVKTQMHKGLPGWLQARIEALDPYAIYEAYRRHEYVFTVYFKYNPDGELYKADNAARWVLSEVNKIEQMGVRHSA